MTSQGRPIQTTIFQSSTGISSFSYLGATPDRDFIEDYPEIITRKTELFVGQNNFRRLEETPMKIK
jgi:hypothetical protein